MNTHSISERYHTPAGFDPLILKAEDGVLCACYFEQEPETGIADEIHPELEAVRTWLDLYFSGHTPDFIPDYTLQNATEFRKEVSSRLLEIPFGATKSYGEIADDIKKKTGKDKMSARAVGQAVGWNPICIIIPCHRVIGKDGTLTGYNSGLNNKIALLKLEKIL